MENDLRFPIGPEPPFITSTADSRARHVADLEQLPARLREAVRDLTDAQLDTRYRPDGWTIRQVVHHLADSHMNGFVRLKLALTEEAPTIKPYNEAPWAELPDSRGAIDSSLALLDGLHARWVALYRSMADAQFSRTFFHPERNEHLALDRHLHIYAWHSRHHVAHITSVQHRLGW